MKCRRLRKQTTACSAGLDSWYDIVEKIASEHFSVSRHLSLYEAVRRSHPDERMSCSAHFDALNQSHFFIPLWAVNLLASEFSMPLSGAHATLTTKSATVQRQQSVRRTVRPTTPQGTVCERKSSRGHPHTDPRPARSSHPVGREYPTAHRLGRIPPAVNFMQKANAGAAAGKHEPGFRCEVWKM
jgi:hypothetical protein